MITEDYVSFEIAKLLKEKGFDEELETLIRPNGSIYFLDESSGFSSVRHIKIKNSDINPYSDSISRPTLQMAMKWLREVHNLHVFTIPVFEDVEYQPGEWQEEMTGYRYEIANIIPNSKIIKDYPKIRALTSESAYEAAIKYCLKNLI